MNVNIFKEEIIIDEGIKYEVYLDHLGKATCGIGHLILKTDPEYKLAIGDKITGERVDELFLQDIETVLEDCVKLYDNFYELPEEAQHIIANMLFNMGLPTLKKFKGMRKAVLAGDWQKAADEMVNSKWYRQVPNRAERLVKRMRNI